MNRSFGNREAHWMWMQHSATQPSKPGSGTTSWSPIATFGGLIAVTIDVDVPAVAAGQQADFQAINPELPDEHFVILDYYGPLDAAKKLHGKGNLFIYDSYVINGTGACGAVAPNTTPGPNGLCDISVELGVDTGGGFSVFWQYQGDNPVDSSDVVNVWTPTSKSVGVAGNDYSGRKSIRLRYANTDMAANLAAGRLRVVLIVAEI